MLITIDESQNSVFAQNSTSTLNSAPLTPAPVASDSNDDDAYWVVDDNSTNV